MNNLKHTPGPWSYKRTHELSSNHWYVIIDKNGKGPIMDVGGTDINGQIAEAKYLVTNEEEIEANAQLIAAAPELFEVISLMLEKYPGSFPLKIREMANAAISKAIGQKEIEN